MDDAGCPVDDSSTAERYPRYLSLFASGELEERARQAAELLHRCELCGRRCQADRSKSNHKAGCRTGMRARVASFGPHHGEESPLTGRRGSGTIFFSYCNLNCLYCQNYDISQLGSGRDVTDIELAAFMIQVQESGCHNINLVSPTHVVPQILSALIVAIESGLRLPIVYNTGGYDSLVTLQLLDGIVDIYMPDMKYSDAKVGKDLSGIAEYPTINQQAVKEMHRQVGDLVLDGNGIAVSGLLVRHLVLPGNLAGTDLTASFLANQISANTYVNVMDQYRPCYKASELNQYPELSKRVTTAEYQHSLKQMMDAGLERFDDRVRFVRFLSF
ncbi:MAG: radical SAM protein [Chloroflexota bacterium]